MALCLLARPSPTGALLIVRLHHTFPAAMRATRLLPRAVEFSSSTMPPQALTFSGRQSTPLCRHGWIALSRGSPKSRCFCSLSGSQHQVGNNPSTAVHSHQGQQLGGDYVAQQQQPSGNPPQQHTSFAQRQQQFGHTSSNNMPSEMQQRGAPGAPAHSSQSTQQSNASSTSPVAGASSSPRTSAAAEVIDKYLGPSTLKLEKRDERSPPPPPPPPRRNYGPQGTQEKKSGKDLVAESAACAVIEKYLGPWPGFPPRDPKIDEYLDSLPENAACAAIDKYFGPYKPLFVFKKNEENSNNPPPPSRPPRSRMMSRARNRAWNASQQGASVDRPWTAPQQQGPTDAGQYSQNAGAGVGSHSQGAAPTSSSQPDTSQHATGGMPPQPPAPPSQPGGMSHHGMAQQQGASTTAPPQGAHMQPPQSGPSSQ